MAPLSPTMVATLRDFALGRLRLGAIDRVDYTVTSVTRNHECFTWYGKSTRPIWCCHRVANRRDTQAGRMWPFCQITERTSPGTDRASPFHRKRNPITHATYIHELRVTNCESRVSPLSFMSGMARYGLPITKFNSWYGLVTWIPGVMVDHAKSNIQAPSSIYR